MGRELIDWIERNRSLIAWLMAADADMEYGQIIINYHGGKITSYDICPRERMEVENKTGGEK